MTIQELRNKLAAFPQDAQVKVGLNFTSNIRPGDSAPLKTIHCFNHGDVELIPDDNVG